MMAKLWMHITLPRETDWSENKEGLKTGLWKGKSRESREWNCWNQEQSEWEDGKLSATPDATEKSDKKVGRGFGFSIRSLLTVLPQNPTLFHSSCS